MVKLHTWLPLAPELILEGLRPDAGHSSLEITDPTEAQLAYVSFWPEPGSLIGNFTEILKPRPHRYPRTYAEDCDPSIGFMQRESDFTDEITGLNEDVMIELWATLADTNYDLMHWNCSNICKLLILHSFDPSKRQELMTDAGCTPEDLVRLAGNENPLEKLRYLATSAFIDCRPEDVRRMVEVYFELAARAKSGEEIAP